MSPSYSLLFLTSHLPLIFGGLGFLYIASLAIYRLYLTPSAKFPGPRLACLTFWYEFYYDVWHEGQYEFKIQELHKEYGPWVRINPDEVHCSDPDFYDVLYVSAGKRRTNKWLWEIKQSWTRNSAFKTMDHDLHKQRRNQLAPFFSKTSIRTMEPLIAGKVDKLSKKLDELSSTNKPVSLTDGFMALTLDIISGVCFGYSYDHLDIEEFAKERHDAIFAFGRTIHLIRQFPSAIKFMSRFPILSSQARTKSLLLAKKRNEELAQEVVAVMDRHARGEKPPNEAFTVFDTMLDADVPSIEKSMLRMTEEAHSLLSAGSYTTAHVLQTITYFLLINPTYLSRLQRELEASIPDPTTIPSTAELEKLPFLSAVVHEGLRMAKGVPHRLARVSPDISYNYGDIIIPKGVPVGMSSGDILENPDIYPDPQSFVPDRWLPFDSPEVIERKKCLIVFSGGTRMCVGMNLAWAELYIATAAVVRRFGGRFVLGEVDFERDLAFAVDGFAPLPTRESKGLRVLVLPKAKA